jgi:hypothetical protein
MNMALYEYAKYFADEDDMDDLMWFAKHIAEEDDVFEDSLVFPQYI